MAERPLDRVTPEELAAEGATALPDKEVLSLLDLNANIDLALDTAAPIDLAIGANANIAAPIDAAVDANILSPGAVSLADATQSGVIDQGITGDATATAAQDSTIEQGATTADATPAPTGSTVGSLDDGNLLNVNVNLDGDLNLAAPIDGAVAANANAAAPIDAAVSANIDTGRPGGITMWDLVDGKKIQNKRPFASMSLKTAKGELNGGTDGVRADVDGNIWASAGWAGEGFDGVHVFTPEGQRIGQILLPETVSNICFGGPKRNRLFITASQSLYAVYVNTQGAHIA